MGVGAFMVDMITPNFSRAEMRCRCGECREDEMDSEFMRMLQELRNEMGPLKISSGRRCHSHNEKSGGYPKSAHLLGQGSDILVSGPRAMKLFEKARQIGFSGIGLSQKGNHADRFIHVDTLEREALWSY